MSIREKIPLRFTSLLLLCVTVIGVTVIFAADNRSYYQIPKALDETVLEVDGRDLTVRDMLFYIAYEEQRIEKDAYAYNPKDTGEYWRAYTNGTFVRLAGKQAVIQMAVHDEIFYQMALEEGLELDGEDETYLANAQYDFFSDLGEEGLTALGNEKEAIAETMRKMTLAQKSQQLYANTQGLEAGDYDFGAEPYEQLLEEHKYRIIKKHWNRVHFGSITVAH